MKIIVVSDSHGSYVELGNIVNNERDADIFLHLGDYELPDYMMERFLCVKGNNDYGTNFPLTRDIDVKGIKIHLEHGHLPSFLFSPNEYVKKINCDIFLFGHTHQKLATKINNILVFNPGSLTRPRDGEDGSYLIIKIDEEKNIDYQFISVPLIY